MHGRGPECGRRALLGALASTALLGPSGSAQGQAQARSSATLPQLQRSAEAGNRSSQAALGGRYLNGYGVPKNYAEAAKWLRLSVAQGEPDGMVNLARMYHYGWGVPKDDTTAFALNSNAAALGNIYAQNDLAVMYREGFGVQRDLKAAFDWAKKPADEGYAVAQAAIAGHYIRGWGVAKDEALAVRYYRLAADQKNPSALAGLAYAYLDGVGGLRPDRAEAIRLFTEAAERGNAYAADKLAELGAARPTTAPAGAVAPTAADSGRRVALVIGNSAYRGRLDPLPNPANDGRLMARRLTDLGFRVNLVLDADHATMTRAIADFRARLTDARGGTGLFFYAGHGVQVLGANYLIPVDAVIAKESDVEAAAIAANSVALQMDEARPGVNILILDACRNAPFGRSVQASSRGLAPMDAPAGTFIAYSTAPGSFAADGEGQNSPFVTALATQIMTPSQPIEGVFREVRRSVITATHGDQIPWDASSLLSPFSFRNGS